MFSLEAPASQLMYSTVMLISTLANGDIVNSGTGFFYEFKVDGERPRQEVVLVTNKHILSGADRVKLTLHEAIYVNKESSRVEPGSASFDVTVSTGDFVDHPRCEDLSAIPIKLVWDEALKLNKKPFYRAIPETIVPGDDTLRELSALEDVVMAGYPEGMIDATHNFPVLRRGITATHSSIDFNGKPVGLVDMAIFPGSSGSPVLILNQGSYMRPSGGLVVSSRILLLGILFGGADHEADGTLSTKNIPGRNMPIAEVKSLIPMHLGYYVKARELKTLTEHLLKKSQRNP